MVKMVKSAQGQMIDWDLLKIQTQVNKNVAEVVEIVDQAAVAARRQQRARLDAAKKLLDAAQKAAPVVEAVTDEPAAETAETETPVARQSKKEKSNAGTY